MKEFEEIPHSGGKITFSNGQTTYECSNPCPLVLYEIVVSFNGIVLARGNFGRDPVPQPSITVMIASDREGYFGYLCPRCEKYFRSTHGTSETIICPYCLYMDNALCFLTKNQKQYIELYFKKTIEHFQTGQELCINMDELVSQLDNNIIKLSKYEERQQRVIECKECKIKFDIIGTYAGCPRCGKRNNIDHFKQEISSIQSQHKKSEINANTALNKIIECYCGLGNDIKYILEKNIPSCAENKKFTKKIDFQKVVETNPILAKLYGLFLFPNDDKEIETFLRLMFQRRHLIAHTGAIVDQQYLDKTSDKTVRLGQKILISDDDLNYFIKLIKSFTSDFFKQFSSLISDYLEKSKKITNHLIY